MSYDERMKVDRVVRRQEDRLKGLSGTKGAQRGDYEFMRRMDKSLIDYRRFKDVRDREKIKKEYFGIEREARQSIIRKQERGG